MKKRGQMGVELVRVNASYESCKSTRHTIPGKPPPRKEVDEITISWKYVSYKDDTILTSFFLQGK